MNTSELAPVCRPRVKTFSIFMTVAALLGILTNLSIASADSNEAPADSLNQPVQSSIALGEYHSCAIDSSSAVKCWGYNLNGQLGNNSTNDSLSPVSVANLGGTPTAITAGSSHTCALLQDGSVKCWGNNESGQLGNGQSGVGKKSTSPVSVANLGGTATAITAGSDHTCALLQGGSVKCWGANLYGQLGQNSQGATVTSPTVVTGLSNVEVIAAGSSHTCAIKNDQTVWCWGRNQSGQLGNGNNDNSSNPVQAKDIDDTFIDDAVSITAGGGHTCALTNNGSVKCWGGNSSGQLGDGKTTHSTKAIQLKLSTVTTVTAITAGLSFTCALLEDGTARCWGFNEYGHLGNGQSGINNGSTTPVTVNNLVGAKAITSGANHTCAATVTTLQCWGDNYFGQLGKGDKFFASVPTPVTANSLVPTQPTPLAKPTAPTITVESGDGEAAISVTPGDGGGPADSYTVTASPNGGTCTVTPPATSCVITGLTNGTTYTFTATATNVSGTSDASAGVTSTPVAPPATPSLTAEPGDGSATVKVTPGNGGGPADSYTVTASPNGGTCTVTPPATSCVITGLTNGTTYTFTATATNGSGTSPSSAGVTSTPIEPPSSPTITVEPDDGKVTVKVTPGSGGGPADSYTVTASPNGGTCTVTSPATSCVITGLTNGTTYTFTATATNGSGTSAASAGVTASPIAALTASQSSSNKKQKSSVTSGSTTTSGGSLPSTGSDLDLLWLVYVMFMMGGSLLYISRVIRTTRYS